MILRNGRPARAGILQIPVLLVLGLVACAAIDTGDVPVDRATSRLYAQAYDKVMDFYIEPLAARDVAMPALRRLSGLDASLAVDVEGQDVVLRSNNLPVERVPAAAPRDARGWGEVTAAMIAAASQHSQAIAAMPTEARDKALFAGLTGALDRFSRYSTPDAAKEEHATREGFEGIGVTLDYGTEEVFITSIVPGSPAEHAGLKIDDHITAIAGNPTSSMSREEIVRRLRGPANSHVEITIQRPGVATPLKKTVSRAYIVVPTIIARRDGTIGIIKISSFNEHTTEMLRSEFAKLRKSAHGNLQGLVLDLRGNPGGLLDQAVSVAETFMPGGRVVATSGRNPDSNQEYAANFGDVTDGLPMIVLVNGGSASSAEIVAAALQDTGRAVIVGSASYGKGTVQMVLPLPNDGELVLTWARLVTPAGYILHEHGVVPAVCTDAAADDDAAITTLLKRSAVAAGSARPHNGLDAAGWKKLRDSCPGETKDREIDVQTAERLLSQPSLYAQMARQELPAVAARGSSASPVQ